MYKYTRHIRAKQRSKDVQTTMIYQPKTRYSKWTKILYTCVLIYLTMLSIYGLRFPKIILFCAIQLVDSASKCNFLGFRLPKSASSFFLHPLKYIKYYHHWPSDSQPIFDLSPYAWRENTLKKKVLSYFKVWTTRNTLPIDV